MLLTGRINERLAKPVVGADPMHVCGEVFSGALQPRTHRSDALVPLGFEVIPDGDRAA
jgi:hypothetical protein